MTGPSSCNSEGERERENKKEGGEGEGRGEEGKLLKQQRILHFVTHLSEHQCQ